ncbi:MAG: hypothetical protein M3R02_01010, partial [Chloroflexota bacterium]|nr:hypothetical protein [Chloroflexota bacterium]
MTSRNLTARLGAVERRRGRGPWRAPVRWIEAVRPGEEGRRDLTEGAGDEGPSLGLDPGPSTGSRARGSSRGPSRGR